MPGKFVILLAVLAGLALGGLSVAYHHWLARRAIAWWGADNIELITRAPRVEALKLSRSNRAIEEGNLRIGAVAYRVQRRNDVTAWPGIDHIRHGLLEDVNFDWASPPSSLEANDWAFGLEFIDGPRHLLVVFDRDTHLGRSERNDALTIARLATGWREFFAEQEQQQGSGGGGRGSGKASSHDEPSR